MQSNDRFLQQGVPAIFFISPILRMACRDRGYPRRAGRPSATNPSCICFRLRPDRYSRKIRSTFCFFRTDRLTISPGVSTAIHLEYDVAVLSFFACPIWLRRDSPRPAKPAKRVIRNSLVSSVFIFSFEVDRIRAIQLRTVLSPSTVFWPRLTDLRGWVDLAVCMRIILLNSSRCQVIP